MNPTPTPQSHDEPLPLTLAFLLSYGAGIIVCWLLLLQLLRARSV